MLLMALGLMAVPVTAVGVAYACTALAVAETNVRTATVGDTVTVTGKFFAPHDPSDIRTSPAIVRMDRVDGPALAQASPNGDGTFSVNITVPATDAGEHVVIITQTGISGAPAYGSPARTVLRVTPAPAAAQAAAAAPAPAVAAPLATPLPAAATSPTPARPGRRIGRLSATVTPREMRAPFSFSTRGTLSLPSAITKSVGCSGRVSVQVKRGDVTISTRRVTLSRNCTYSSRVTFANSRRFGSTKRLKFTARFLGNARVLPTAATPRYSRIRR